jgi:hypothetical protein
VLQKSTRKKTNAKMKLIFDPKQLIFKLIGMTNGMDFRKDKKINFF